MKWDELADQQCSVSRALSVVGDRWTLLILSDCFLGAQRFETFQRRLGISRTTLADRLAHLEGCGVLRRNIYQQQPRRSEYRLTQKGLGLHGLMLALSDWGDAHYAGKAGPPMLHRHQLCGHDFHAVSSCSECGGDLLPQQVEVRERPSRRGVPAVLRGPIKERGSA